MTDSNRPVPSREELALAYLEQLPFTPYPVQEQALYAWFGSDQGVLVSAPTGTGKTLIAEAAAYEALRTNSVMYYTTPLIALTEQKFQEMQDAAERWGFQRDDVGLVTGNRRVNPEARVLVVVAEILLNRLLQPQAFNFDAVSAVVMDEFHSFADMERGIVWEFSLSLLPKHIRLMLLSATVGNGIEFLLWFQQQHGRRLEFVQSQERKVPLSFEWVPDKFLTEHLEWMATGEDELRKTPALVFCFNRDECWSTAEELKGKSMLADGQQAALAARINKGEWSQGAGPKLKQILLRGVGVHHAGLLPRYRRIVEELFQKKLLTICVCTETLSAGINLPARSVVMPCLIKGPPGKQKLIDGSTAHQIFGRAGRPQFDDRGFVYALPHEDDVRILHWREKYDQIPEDTKDPNLIRAKKALKKKQPTRSPNRQYWNESQFTKLQTAPPRDLVSQGALPWRMLAYMLQISPDVSLVRKLVHQRLMDAKRLAEGERHLDEMLLTLHAAGVIRLEPEPPPPPSETPTPQKTEEPKPAAEPPRAKPSAFAQLMLEAMQERHAETGTGPAPVFVTDEPVAPAYRAERAHPTPKLAEFFLFRSINPVFALFVTELLGRANEQERLQIFESVLELPKSLLRSVRVPPPHKMPPGPLAREYLDTAIVQRGLIAAEDLYPEFDPDIPFEERKYAPPLGDKLRMLFDATYPRVHGVFVQSCWAAGELLEFEGNFQNYITSRDLTKQEGLIFRHLLRLVLLLGEFSQVTPPGLDPEQWRSDLRTLADRLTATCHKVDPQSTEYTLAHAADQDILVKGEATAVVETSATTPGEPAAEADDFGADLFDAD